jgi:hypothetical protein
VNLWGIKNKMPKVDLYTKVPTYNRKQNFAISTQILATLQLLKCYENAKPKDNFQIIFTVKD